MRYLLGDVRWALPALYLSLLGIEAAVLVPTYLVVRPASGSVFNAAVGTFAILCMIGMLVYSLARRSRRLRRIMRLSLWLHLHIFLGLQGILLAYVHCLPLFWRPGPPTLLNPGMLNLYAMTIVFLSGLFGRYLFAQVPTTVGGQHLTIEALDAELAELNQPVPAEVSALWADPPGASGFSGVVTAGRHRRRALRQLAALELSPDVYALAERRLGLMHKKAALTSARRLFSTWIFLHRPIAGAMYLITAVHVVLSLLFTPSLGLI
ncbi:MAG: hypothetical protein KTR31_06695 [Myxococcales bacterium]|nr:hypothetical protein [Myxococcales bacterium]